MPPAVGIAEASSDIEHATNRISTQISGQRDRDRDRPAVLERLPVGREAAGEDADDRERDREVGEPAPAPVQLLLVAQLGEALLVGAQCSRSCSSARPLKEKRFGRPSFARDNTLDRGRKSSSRAANRERRAGQLANAGRRRQPPGKQPGEDVLGALQVLAHHARRAHRVALAHRGEQPAVLGVGGARAPRAGGRCGRSGRSSRPAPRSSPRTSRARAAWPRRGRRAGGRRPGGRRRSPRACPSSAAATSSSASRSARLGALGGEHRDAELDRQALVAGLAPLREHLRRGRIRRRLRVGDERAAAAPARREHVPALAERGQRLAQRRARDPQPRAQLALGRQPRSRAASRPSLIAVPSRSTVSSNAVCERTGANTASERQRAGGEPAAQRAHRAPLRAHSRSNPRTRSQSVTAASKAASSTSAALR